MTRYVRGMLFGITPLDPGTFIGVAVLFAIVAAVAARDPGAPRHQSRPARRASHRLSVPLCAP